MTTMPRARRPGPTPRRDDDVRTIDERAVQPGRAEPAVGLLLRPRLHPQAPRAIPRRHRVRGTRGADPRGDEVRPGAGEVLDVCQMVDASPGPPRRGEIVRRPYPRPRVRRGVQVRRLPGPRGELRRSDGSDPGAGGPARGPRG